MDMVAVEPRFADAIRFPAKAPFSAPGVATAAHRETSRSNVSV
jgi:hypothetical protein